MKKFATLSIVISTLLLGVTAPVVHVQAQTPAYRLIERDMAASNRIQVQVTPGRATPISFNQADEAIAYILVADPSRLVYTTDTDLKSGRATTIFLRSIQDTINR
jgi:spore germination protein YaaH